MPCKPAESVSGRPHTPCCSHLPIGAFAPVLTPAPVRRFIMSLQKSALNGLTADHHVAFCFTFLYAFPFLFDYIVSWAPPWYPPTHLFTPLPIVAKPCHLALANWRLQFGLSCANSMKCDWCMDTGLRCVCGMPSSSSSSACKGVRAWSVRHGGSCLSSSCWKGSLTTAFCSTSMVRATPTEVSLRQTQTVLRLRRVRRFGAAGVCVPAVGPQDAVAPADDLPGLTDCADLPGVSSGPSLNCSIAARDNVGSGPAEACIRAVF